MRKSVIVQHGILIFGCLFLIMPIVVAFMSSTHTPETIDSQGLQLTWGGNFIETYKAVLFDKTGFTDNVNGVNMLKNSFILGFGFALGKIFISMLAAYAIVYFRFPFATLSFGIIFTTLLLPLEVRIIPSYEVVASMGLLNTHAGLILPLIASATATFYFRQFFKTIPDELLEAARLDNAGPYRFFVDILLPLSRTMMAAIFIIMFVVGWNQYLWPLLMTTEEALYPIVIGIRQITNVVDSGAIPEYNKAFALAILAMLPPVMVVLLFQRWFVKGLVESEK